MKQILITGLSSPSNIRQFTITSLKDTVYRYHYRAALAPLHDKYWDCVRASLEVEC